MMAQTEAADAEMAECRKRSGPDLLAEVARGCYGSYNQIWYALQGRTTIEEAGALLLGILRSQADYLVRYHCATLLLSLYNPFPDVLTRAEVKIVTFAIFCFFFCLKVSSY